MGREIAIALLALAACRTPEKKPAPAAMGPVDPSGDQVLFRHVPHGVGIVRVESVSAEGVAGEILGTLELLKSGQELTGLLYTRDDRKLWEKLSDRARSHLGSFERFAVAQQKIAAQLHPEEEVLTESVVLKRGVPTYVRAVRMQSVVQPQAIEWNLAGRDRYQGLTIRPAADWELQAAETNPPR